MHNEELCRVQEELEISRKKYAALFDFAPVACFTFDAHGLIREVNLTGAHMLGSEQQELTNTPFVEFVADAGEKKKFWQHLANVLKNQGRDTCEIRLTRKDQAQIFGRLQSVCLDLGEKNEKQILCSIADDRLGKQQETAIQDAREYAENIVETVHNPLVVLNSDLRILSANQSFFQTFKVTPEETLGNFIYDLGNRQWDIPNLRVLFEEILPRNSVFNGYEVDDEFPGIGRRTIRLNARQISRKNVGSRIILVAMEDITERNWAAGERTRIEQILQNQNIELERATVVAEKANLAKSDFLASMSHELRTPLGAILGFAQLLESSNPPPTPTQTRSIDQILKAGWYLLELINEILDLAQVESGKLSLSLEPVLLSEVMLECEVMIEPQARERGIRVDFSHFETPCFVEADRTRVKQVLINLLSNAIKYNREEGSVSVACTRCDAGVIRISVKDTGAGLAPEQLAQLFQPFNRLGQEATIEGTGIGLVVCKRLVELMGGKIGMESRVGEGSVFWFELNPAAEIACSDHSVPLLTTVLQAQAQRDPQISTLLYVEDNPANLMLVEDIVAQRPDIRFVSARNAILGIEMARTLLPDVILMDINLPGISGLEALKILVDDPTTANIPVIALSANALPRDIEKSLEAGFFQYLTKPIKVKKFMDILDLALNFSGTQASGSAQKDIF
ncbi:MAG: response regulator [Deltaproteobacteria bacterium]|nr:response regulator [Deltaproteobacteria bacterium]NCP02281.1 response regulator [Deltaproteobacteria bacterium]